MAGWILLRVFAVILPVFDFPGCLWILLLVPARRIFDYLYYRQLSLVYYLCGILEAPGG